MTREPIPHRPGRVLVLCPDWPQPSGGVRKMYRHADVLNAHGIWAAVVHQQPGFRCRWFANDTRVVYQSDVWPPAPDDTLLVPENIAWQLAAAAPGARKVIFNQNAYQTFLGRPATAAAAPAPAVPYRHPDFCATIVVSEDSRQYLEYAFPGHPVFRVHNSVDPALFYFEPAAKRPQVAFMPRKKAADAAQVLGLLGAGALDGVAVVPIAGKSEAETARIVRESLVFLSFSSQEGAPLPPLEAMASGCLTVGYHGRGGREFFDDAHAFPVEAEDVVGFARAVEGIIRQARENPRPLSEMARRAATFVRETYSPEREERDILAAWTELLRRP